MSYTNNDAVLTTSAAAIFASGATSTLITKATVTNTDSISHSVTLYRVTAGGSASAANIIGADAQSIGAGATQVIPISGQTLANGQTIQAKADLGAVVNVSISGSTT